MDDGLSEYARSGSSQSDPGIGVLLEKIATRIPADQARYDHMKFVQFCCLILISSLYLSISFLLYSVVANIFMILYSMG